MTREMTGAKMVVQALKDQGVDTVFGIPAARSPIYDEVFQQNDIRHILSATNRARCMRQKGMPGLPANLALFWSPRAPGRPMP